MSLETLSTQPRFPLKDQQPCPVPTLDLPLFSGLLFGSLSFRLRQVYLVHYISCVLAKADSETKLSKQNVHLGCDFRVNK